MAKKSEKKKEIIPSTGIEGIEDLKGLIEERHRWYNQVRVKLANNQLIGLMSADNLHKLKDGTLVLVTSHGIHTVIGVTMVSPLKVMKPLPPSIKVNEIKRDYDAKKNELEDDIIGLKDDILIITRERDTLQGKVDSVDSQFASYKQNIDIDKAEKKQNENLIKKQSAKIKKLEKAIKKLTGGDDEESKDPLKELFDVDDEPGDTNAPPKAPK